MSFTDPFHTGCRETWSGSRILAFGDGQWHTARHSSTGHRDIHRNHIDLKFHKNILIYRKSCIDPVGLKTVLTWHHFSRFFCRILKDHPSLARKSHDFEINMNHRNKTRACFHWFYNLPRLIPWIILPKGRASKVVFLSFIRNPKMHPIKPLAPCGKPTRAFSNNGS